MTEILLNKTQNRNPSILLESLHCTRNSVHSVRRVVSLRLDFNIITEFVLKKTKAFCPTIGARRSCRRGKTPMAFSCSFIRMIFFFLKILISLPENNNPFRLDILFHSHEYPSKWAFCPTLVYTFHYVT